MGEKSGKRKILRIITSSDILEQLREYPDINDGKVLGIDYYLQVNGNFLTSLKLKIRAWVKRRDSKKPMGTRKTTRLSGQVGTDVDKKLCHNSLANGARIQNLAQW